MIDINSIDIKSELLNLYNNTLNNINDLSNLQIKLFEV